MGVCAVFRCYSNTRNLGKSDLRFYRFPRDKKTCRKWKIACRRADTYDARNVRVCSRHIIKSDYSPRSDGATWGLQAARALKPGAEPSAHIPSKPHAGCCSLGVAGARRLLSCLQTDGEDEEEDEAMLQRRDIDSVGSDEAVIATNDDASSCKRCAVALGYWRDRYINYFVRSTDRKAPEINRGYFARSVAIKMLVDKFIEVTNGNCQIVNIGAGFDTLYWRLVDEGKTVKGFVEFDFPGVTSRKCLYIQRTKQLLQAVSDEDYDVKLNRNNLHGHTYKLTGLDLRNLTDVEAKVKESDLQYSLPTLFLAECVLVYISIQKSSQLLKWIAEKFKSALFINYEMVNLGDRFGEVMLSNLRSRGCDLAGSEACQSTETQRKRFLDNGWAGADSYDMVGVWARLPPEEIARVTQIELLDEQELLHQLFTHYAITTAWTDHRWSEVQL